MKYILILIIAFFAFEKASATHIIGGSLSYQYLGANVYTIRLEVLRDCFNGAADAQFDDPASIGISNQFGTFPLGYPDGELRINFNNQESSILDTLSLCTFSTGVCVSRTVYVSNVVLPYVDGGWTLAYQRCCRSMIVSNLINPLETGMTFEAHIQPLDSNSSPVFKKNVPYAVFVNTAFVYDASATDLDGDSLAYELITPHSGADKNFPKPQPPPPPPYDYIVWKAPYSESNMLGGSYPLKINPLTGEMSAIPSTVGTFQIAYAVKEYRNDSLKGTNIREFTFLVGYPPADLKFDVFGAVFIDESTQLDHGLVRLFNRDITTDSLHLFDEQEVGPGDQYLFEDVPGGVFYVKAIVDPASMYFNTYVPTYYNSSYFWYDATTLNQCDTSQYYRDIYLIHVDSLHGIHILDGTVFNSGRSFETVPGLDLLLADAEGNPVQYRTTDQNGYFKFDHLPSGSYQLMADLINSELDNSHPPHIDINGNKTVEVFLYKDSLSLHEPTGISPVIKKDELEINVYPNPSSDKITLEIKSEEDREISCVVMDLNGRSVVTKKIRTNLPYTIDLFNLADAIYVLRIENPNGFSYKKFVTHR